MEAIIETEDGAGMRPPVPLRNQQGNPPLVPVNNNPKRRPIGAVATVMVPSGTSPTGGIGKRQEEVITDAEMEQSHANNPYDLKAVTGSTVTASYPFDGEACLQQLSFTVGDVIKVKQKEEMWSWGVLERGGKEGWFPHNYVGTTFMPLPGIHEMAAKLRERRGKQEEDKAREEGSQDAGANQQPPTSLLSKTEEEASTISATSLGTAVPRDGSGGNVDGQGGPGQRAGALTGAVAHEEALFGLHKTVTIAATGRSALSPSASESAQARSVVAPSLPPFVKSGAASGGSAYAVLPNQRTTEEAGTTQEMVATTQIAGVGFAGTPDAVQTGCNCVIA